MKALLINPYPYYAKGVEGIVYPPLGLLYLASVARKRGLAEVKVIDANVMKMDNQGLIHKITAYQPDIIGVSSNIVTHQAALGLLRMIRENNLRQPLLAGGPFPLLFPEKYLDYCDLVVNGEGEEVFCDILRLYADGSSSLSKAGIAGISYKEKDKVVSTPQRGFIRDLDSVPFPDYYALDPKIDYYSRHSRVVGRIMAPIMTSRGCPYQCSYCNKSVFGSNFRYRSPDNIIREIDWLNSNFKVDQLDILDDNFNFALERAEEVLDKIIQGGLKLAISCHNGLRADKMSLGFAEKLKRSGVFKAGIGIETGDPDLMIQIKKRLSLDEVKKAIALLRSQGITVHGYFILGLPSDTPDTMQRTINFAKEANPHFCNFATCIPFPGTELFNKIKNEGRFLADVENGISSGFFDGKVFFEINGTKAEDVDFYYKKAYREFYFNINKIIDIILAIRSFKELRWLVSTSWSLFLNAMLKPKRKR